MNYCHLLKERVRVLSENSDHSIAINMVAEHIFTRVRLETFLHIFLRVSQVFFFFLLLLPLPLQLCVVVNDLEHLRSVLTRLPAQLNWEVLRVRTESVIGQSQFENTLHSQLQQAKSILCKEIRSALDTLGRQVRRRSRALVCSIGTSCDEPTR